MIKFASFFFLIVAFLIYQYLFTPPSITTEEKTEFVEVLNASYDYIVVGSGSAGAVVANRLSEDYDVTVLLVEAGGDDRGNEFVKAGYKNSRAATDPRVSRSFYSEPQPNVLTGVRNGRAHCPRGMVLGGSGSINGMMYVRGSRHDYDRWAAYTGDETWNYRHVLPYFIKSEGMTDPDLRSSPYHGTEGPQKISILGKTSKISQKIVEAFQEAGYPFNEDYNGETLEGIAYPQTNIFNNNQRNSPAVSFIHPILNRPNLHVSILTFVQKVVFDDQKRAIGVIAIKNNKKVFVRANKEVILSAGAIQSPQILMLSGVGPKAHLEKMGIPVVANLPVGQNLQDHLMVYLYISLTEPWVNPDNTHIQENMFFSSTTQKTKAMDWPDLQIFGLSRLVNRKTMKSFFNFEDRRIDEMLPLDKERSYGWMCVPALLRPASRGNLTLRSLDPFDDPIMFMNYLDKDEDLQVLLRGIEVCKTILKTKVMKEGGAKMTEPMPIDQCKQFEPDSTVYWSCYIRVNAQTIYHHSGTCAMGSENDSSAVVDSKLRVKVVKNLRVVDASVMPFVTSANTHAPTVMIGEKGADMIRGRKPLAPLDL